MDEPLLLYIATMTQVVSATLTLEHEKQGHALKCSVGFERTLMSPRWK